MVPFWRNMFENIGAVQFNHRILAYIILAVTIWIFITTKRQQRVRRHMIWFKVIVLWQILLGIYVLLTGDALWLALLHQFSAIFVWLAVVAVMRSARKV